MPEAAVLAGIRQEIDYNYSDWKKIITNKHFIKTFEGGIKSSDVLVRPPKGYEEANPAIEYLKMKSFIVSKTYTDIDLQQPDFVKKVAGTFKIMKPVIDFLNTAIQ